MKDIYNREVKIGDTVVFNHPNYSLLESSVVLDIVPLVGIKAIYHNPDNTVAETIVPEKQFAIIREVHDGK
jgi:positive regulator of sigma E activity